MSQTLSASASPVLVAMKDDGLDVVSSQVPKVKKATSKKAPSKKVPSKKAPSNPDNTSTSADGVNQASGANQVNQVANEASTGKVKKARKVTVRFNPLLPSSFLDRAKVMDYFHNRRVNLEKNEARLNAPNAASVSAEEEKARDVQKARLRQTVTRLSEELKSAHERDADVAAQLKWLVSLKTAGVPLQPAVEQYLSSAASRVVTSLSTTVAVDSEDDSKPEDESK